MAEENKQLFARTALLLGQPVMERLAGTRVILFGVGGVGSWCAEALIRSGIGHLTMVDGDVVMPTNLNRQLPALTDTIGQPKVAVLKQRLQRINPDAQIEAVQGRYNADTAESFHLENYDFVIDAIDSVADKALLIRHATSIPTIHLFSSMGAARKLDPTRIRIAGCILPASSCACIATSNSPTLRMCPPTRRAPTARWHTSQPSSAICLPRWLSTPLCNIPFFRTYTTRRAGSSCPDWCSRNSRRYGGR